jgi:hypothetical protein
MNVKKTTKKLKSETFEERISELEHKIHKIGKNIIKQDKFLANMLIHTDRAYSNAEEARILFQRINERLDNLWYIKILKRLKLRKKYD